MSDPFQEKDCFFVGHLGVRCTLRLVIRDRCRKVSHSSAEHKVNEKWVDIASYKPDCSNSKSHINWEYLSYIFCGFLRICKLFWVWQVMCITWHSYEDASKAYRKCDNILHLDSWKCKNELKRKHMHLQIYCKTCLHSIRQCTLGWLRLCTVLSNWKIDGRHKIFWLLTL